MIDKLRAAAQAALKALERSRAYVYETDRPQIDGSMDALRAALAEPEVEQEPADDVWFEDWNGACRKSPRDCQRFGANGTPEAVWVNGDRYVRREWQGLTDEEALRAISPDLYHHIEGAERETRLADARAIEAALNERNA